MGHLYNEVFLSEPASWKDLVTHIIRRTNFPFMFIVSKRPNIVQRQA